MVILGFLLVLLCGGCSRLALLPLLFPFNDPFPPSVRGQSGQGLVDIGREEAMICGRK